MFEPETEGEMEMRHIKEMTVLRAKQKDELNGLRGGVPRLYRQTALQRAEVFLRVFLSEGSEASFADLVLVAKKAGIGLSLLRQAKKSLGVESYKIGLFWYWRFRPSAEVPQG